MLASANLSNRLAVDVQSVDALRMKAASGDPGALRAVARQFEAMMVQTMLKSVRSSSLSADGDVFGSSSSMKLYQELLDQQWAQNIVAGKGLGLADMLVKRLNQDGIGKTENSASETGQHAGKAVPIFTGNVPAEAQPQHAARHLADSAGQHAEGEGGRHSGKGQGHDRKRSFVEAMLPYAQKAEQATGVPARFVLAHAALESGWGRHEIVAANGKASHNLFGIKAEGGWDGDSVSTITTEYRQGLAMKISARFRAYADYAEAFVDYARLLQRRYRNAVAAGSDASAFANGLANGGYATDPTYAAKLQGAIRSIAAAGA